MAFSTFKHLTYFLRTQQTLDSFNDSADSSRTQFVLVGKPKFIKVENSNEVPPSSPSKLQNLSIEPDDDDVVMVKNSQSSDEGNLQIRQLFC